MLRAKGMLPSSSTRLLPLLSSLLRSTATPPLHSHFQVTTPFSIPFSSLPSPPPPPKSHLFPVHSYLPTLPFSSSSSSTPDSDPSDQTQLPNLSSTPTNESVLYVLKKLDKNPQKALDFLNFVKSQHGFNPSTATYNLMLRILGHKDWMKDFWVLLKTMQDDDHSIDKGTYMTLLGTFKKHNMTNESKSLVQFYSQATEKAETDAVVCNAAEIVQGSESWNEEVEKKLQDLNLSLSETTVIKVLREVRDSPSKALGFFRWAGKRPDYKHGSVAYNAIVRVLGSILAYNPTVQILGREDTIEDFWSLIKEMKGDGHEIDIDTYIKLSRQFQKSRMMKEAVELYEFMMDGPYKPAIQDCGVLLRQISLSGSPDLDLVFRVVRKYEAAGHSLSKVVYDGIHRSLTSIGRFEEAEEILKRMKDEGYEPDNITYSQLVYGLCKAKRLDEACKVLDEMEAGGCVPDLKTWTVLIQGHCTAGEVDKALDYLTKMIEKNYKADADLIGVLVKGLCSKNRATGAYTLVTEMVERASLRPWQATYKHLISELLGCGKLEEALKLLGLMKKHKFPPFADPFAPYISKFGTIEDAREFLKALTVTSYPSSSAYLHVFKSFFDEGRYTEAQDLLFKCPHHIRKHADISKLFGSIKVESAT